MPLCVPLVNQYSLWLNNLFDVQLKVALKMNGLYALGRSIQQCPLTPLNSCSPSHHELQLHYISCLPLNMPDRPFSGVLALLPFCRCLRDLLVYLLHVFTYLLPSQKATLITYFKVIIGFYYSLYPPFWVLNHQLTYCVFIYCLFVYCLFYSLVC